MSATSETHPESRMLAVDESTKEAVAAIVDAGGFAWTKPSYGHTMSGRSEYMGDELLYFTAERVNAASSELSRLHAAGWRVADDGDPYEVVGG